MILKIILALYGLVFYHAFVFVAYKDKLDSKEIKINIKQYVVKYWDNWVLSALALPLMVYFTPEMVVIYNVATGSSLTPGNIFYVGIGFVIEFLYGLYKKKDRDNFFDNCSNEQP